MFNIYRIVEQQNINGNIVFVPQQKKFILFWIPFMETNMFPRKIEFETFENAKRFLDRQIEKPKEKFYYF